MIVKQIWRRFKRRFLIFPAIYVAKGLLRLLVKTCRIDIHGLESFSQIASKEKCILMLWHNRLLILPEILQAYAPQFLYRAVISKSRDGEMLSILVNSYSAGRTLRVSHHARHQALSQMINKLKNNHEVIILTPDGPRGPRYQVKRGIAMASRMTSASVVMLTWSSSQFWQLKSWDKLIIPKPFSRIRIELGKPVYLKDDSDQELSSDTKMLQDFLLHLDEKNCVAVTRDSKRWPA